MNNVCLDSSRQKEKKKTPHPKLVSKSLIPLQCLVAGSQQRPDVGQRSIIYKDESPLVAPQQQISACQLFGFVVPLGARTLFFSFPTWFQDKQQQKLFQQSLDGSPSFLRSGLCSSGRVASYTFRDAKGGKQRRCGRKQRRGERGMRERRGGMKEG